MGKAAASRATSDKSRLVPPGYWRWHVCKKNRQATRETPTTRGRGSQLELREEQAGSFGVADRLVVLMTPGNAGRGKEPDFWRVPGRDQQPGDWLCLSTPLKGWAVTERTLLAIEDGNVVGVTTEMKQSYRVLASEASLKAGCGKSARPV